jgi:DNA-binding transcriptional regulator LsrR (DeoR family)
MPSISRFTQAVLGDALGLSMVHVNRSLMELRGRGLITLDKHVLRILKSEELCEDAYLHFDGLLEPA